MKLTNNSCAYCLVINLCINFVLCILIYKFDSVFLFNAQPSDNMKYASKSMPTETIVNDEGHSQSKGYIIPYKIYEQQTSATRNLWGLQLWAKSAGMKVVEPFISEHVFSFEALVNGTTNPLKFSDLYDRDYWNSHTTVNGCAPLVSWEELLHKALRKTILVLPFAYTGLNVKHYKMVDSIDDPSKITGSRNCHSVYFSELAMNYFNDLGFQFVREVCIKFKRDIPPLTMEQFAEHIFGQYKPSEVTVIFALWQGIRQSRINLSGVDLTRTNTIQVALMPSKKIIKESDQYVQHFVPAGNKYFGVMVRVERMVLLFQKSLGFNKVMKYMAQCAKQLARLQQFKDHHKWGRTLAIDLGRMGSRGLLDDCIRHQQYCGVSKLFDLFLTSVFGKDSWSIEDYEGSFTKHISTDKNDNPAYVAQLQRTIAARSDCMIMIGGKSNFQTAAITFYKNFHPNVTEQCIIYHCYYGVNFNIE